MSMISAGLTALLLLGELSGVPFPVAVCLFVGLPILMAILQYRLCADGYDRNVRQLPPLLTGAAAIFFRVQAVFLPDLDLFSGGISLLPLSDWDLLLLSAGLCLLGMIFGVLCARSRPRCR